MLNPAILRRAFWTLADVVFPPRCVGCGRQGERWCEACQALSLSVSAPLCPGCARPGRCDDCSPDAGGALIALRAGAWFTGSVQRGLIRLKYRRDLPLADTLAEWAAPRLAAANWPIDLIVAVPLAGDKARARGYNQAALLARPLAEILGLPFDADVLRRRSERRSQVGLSWAERQANVSEAFVAEPGPVAGRRVLVVDDTCTTGATLRACAQALHRAGAHEVRAFALAQARLRRTRTAVGVNPSSNLGYT